MPDTAVGSLNKPSMVYLRILKETPFALTTTTIYLLLSMHNARRGTRNGIDIYRNNARRGRVVVRAATCYVLRAAPFRAISIVRVSSCWRWRLMLLWLLF